MKHLTRLTAAALTLAMVASLTACEESGAPAGTPGAPVAPGTTTAASTTTVDPDENAATDAEIKDVSSADFTPDGNSGKIVWLGYYSLADDGSSSEQYKIFTSETYGGEIEYISSSSGTAYFEKLGTMIAADDSPDIVRYEWQSFPYGMSKNMYEPLDEYIDVTTPMWKDMAEVAENFAYKGKHYYYPYRITTNFAINYNRKAIEEASLPDPYDLYMENNWTWDTFKDLLIQWCNLDEENIGYYGEGGMSFIATTGTTLIDVQPDGTVKNNVNDPNVTRAMEFLSTLNREGLAYQKELGDWIDPALWAQHSNRLLLYGMNPEWTYSAASGAIQNPSGVENDICNTVSDFAFVPFPRDPQSDKYTIAYDTFGYMVAKGAKNVKGAVDWIQLNRVYQTDENLRATAREDAINPTPVYYTAGKYEGMQKWGLVWDPNIYDLWQDMMDTSKFNFVFDDCYGFNTELTTLAETLLDGPLFNGDSWTQLSAENAPLIDAQLADYNS